MSAAAKDRGAWDASVKALADSMTVPVGPPGLIDRRFVVVKHLKSAHRKTARVLPLKVFVRAILRNGSADFDLHTAAMLWADRKGLRGPWTP